jgi:mannose-6-phosphate isomerase-like protein (cupin superfamily)
MSIESLEGFEASWKHLLGEILGAPLAGSDARRIAAFQRDIGLLPKYKSYAIKASSPLGYSVFFQEPGQGFSFQQHRHHKVEIFHILETRPDSFGLICTLEDWNAHYEEDAFSRWLEGESDPRYERWRIPLSPGDVLCLERTGLVHSVIGCILEEFATASTDMVDRLHDQNLGASIPASYCRDKALHLLRTTPSPSASRLVTGPGQERLPLARQGFPGGEIVTLGEVPGLRASRIRLEGERHSPWQMSEENAVVLFTSRGAATLLLGTAEELADEDPPALELFQGAAAMIPPGMVYQVSSLSADVEISLHAIHPDVALMRTSPPVKSSSPSRH